jgi:hypothetical protein
MPEQRREESDHNDDENGLRERREEKEVIKEVKLSSREREMNKFMRLIIH